MKQSKFKLSLVILVALILALSACGQRATQISQPADQSSQAAQPELKGDIAVSGALRALSDDDPLGGRISKNPPRRHF